MDTHVLVWWASGEHQNFGDAALRAIEGELTGGQIIVSAISVWEVAMLVERDRLRLSMDIAEWLSVVSSIDEVSFMPVDNEIALKSVALPGDFHKDPADRIIVATARQIGAPLVTADHKIRAYPHMRTIW